MWCDMESEEMNVEIHNLDPRRAWLESNLEIRDHRSKPHEVEANCPFCHLRTPHTRPDTKYHLGVSLKPGFLVAHCFRCDWSGSLIGLICEYSGMAYRDAHKLVYEDRLNFKSSHGSGVVAPDTNNSPMPVDLPGHLLSRRSVLDFVAYKYLKNRDVSDNIIRRFDLHFASTGDYAQRIVVPIKRGGQLVGFQARTIRKEEPKYRYPPGFSAAKHLFNIDEARRHKWTIIVEGVFDAWRVGKRAVALFGKHMSSTQKLTLVETWREAVVMLDGDAQVSAVKIARELETQGMRVSVATLPPNRDPASLAPVEVSAAIDGARLSSLITLPSTGEKYEMREEQ